MTARVDRKLDYRKAKTPFIRVVRTIGRQYALSDPMGVITRAHSSASGARRTFRSFDSHNGVVLVTNMSDLPATRRQAQRILGVPVQTIHADSIGTVYAPKGV